MSALTTKIGRIDNNSRLPKYRQVINTILEEINQEMFKPGDRIPSINETSEEYYLSRDTVEKAYKELSQRGIISSIPGKGFYVNSIAEAAKLRVLVVFNKISDYKKVVYNSLIKSLGKKAIVSLHLHNSDFKYFEELILSSLGNYDYYVVMPHFYDFRAEVEEVLNKIPRNKLLIMDKQVRKLSGNYAEVYQDFASDLEQALMSGMDMIQKYRKLYLVYPIHVNYPREIRVGFRNFCHNTDFDYDLIPDIKGQQPKKGEAYIVINENDLIELVKKCKEANLEPGKDIGIISYNDSPLKEVICNGITVVSTDHNQMGQIAGEMILNKKRDSVKNRFYMLMRNSL